MSFGVFPKSDCDACKFDYNGGTTLKEFSNYYQDTCLEDRYKEGEPVYFNIDDLDVGYTDKGLLNITIKNDTSTS